MTAQLIQAHRDYMDAYDEDFVFRPERLPGDAPAVGDRVKPRGGVSCGTVVRVNGVLQQHVAGALVNLYNVHIDPCNQGWASIEAVIVRSPSWRFPVKWQEADGYYRGAL